MSRARLTFWRTLKTLADGQWIGAHHAIRHCEGDGEPVVCPVCAVVNAALGYHYVSTSALAVIDMIHLDREFACKVMHASDVAHNSDRVIAGIRKQILKVLGL